ncbi:MAG: DUF547 domain-containing protein [Rhodospirillales bacterium]|jgi:hypothetical protein
MRRILLAVALMLGLVQTASGAPKAEAWEFWRAHDATSTQSIDHAQWSRLLATYRSEGKDGIARFAYGSVSVADRAALQAYLAALQAVAPRTLSRPQQKAYWINLYNAATVETILTRYPVASIRDIRTSPGLFAVGPWGAKILRVENQALSLDDIEHRILRPLWQDPRIHYALNCAALGCPNLDAEAFEADRLDTQLDAAARRFVASPRGVRVGPRGLVLSSIYDWFKEDFGADEAGLRAHLLGYATAETRAALERGAPIASYSYDWALNAAP